MNQRNRAHPSAQMWRTQCAQEDKSRMEYEIKFKQRLVCPASRRRRRLHPRSRINFFFTTIEITFSIPRTQRAMGTRETYRERENKKQT